MASVLAEKAVREAFGRGDLVDLRDAEDTTVPASLLRSLLLGADAAEPGHLAALRVKGAHVTGALDLGYAEITCPIQLEDCRFEEPVDVYGAHLRHLSLGGSRLAGVNASTATFDGNVRLTGCRSRGQVRLLGARIAGSLLLNGADLEAPGVDVTMQALRLTVDNDVLGGDGFTCRGEICLNNAEVRGAVRFEGARLVNPGRTAISAIGLTVGGTVNICAGARVEGRMVFSYARIGHRLCLHDTDLAGLSRLACHHTETPELRLLPATPIGGEVDLRHAVIGRIEDDPATWPVRLFLDGLRYDALSGTEEGVDRLRWVRLDPSGHQPQVYEQLASAYRRQGRDAEARGALLASQRHRRASLRPIGRVWAYLQDVTVGYGYRPTRAVGWLLALLALGTVVFTVDQPTPVDPDRAPDLHPPVYTLDLMLPIVDFGQQDAFQPHGAAAWVGYGLIAAGWVLATTVAAGATRALRRE